MVKAGSLPLESPGIDFGCALVWGYPPISPSRSKDKIKEKKKKLL